MAVWELRSVTPHIELIDSSISHAQLSQANKDPEAKRDTIYELGLVSPNLLPARVPAEGQLCTDF